MSHIIPLFCVKLSSGFHLSQSSSSYKGLLLVPCMLRTSLPLSSPLLRPLHSLCSGHTTLPNDLYHVRQPLSPLGLCTCCSLHLESFFPIKCQGSRPHFFQVFVHNSLSLAILFRISVLLPTCSNTPFRRLLFVSSSRTLSSSDSYILYVFLSLMVGLPL